MSTLYELKRENERLRNIQQGVNEMRQIQSERMKLIKENKRLSRNIKYGRSFEVGKNVGKKVTTGSIKLFKTLQRLGANLQAAEDREKRLNKKFKISSQKKSHSKRRK